ncbi:MAG: enoyl-CoA hydratase/isomerase family protein, partial [Sphingomonadaceae bacterium]|nr:enoyl-CoA hydratase/isomerase family protein [Sphingomonadaceae bacterium]
MTAINDVVDLSRDGEIAVITVNSPPVNALSAPVRDGIAEGVTSAVADPEVKAIVLVCAGRTFIAGADITEFGKPPRGVSLHDMIDRIESATKPVIAAIHGTALGGGLETALGAHYRVAVPSAKLGLPEVKLGLLPGAGGTQRLPRVVGAEAALKMVTSGNPIGAKAALDSGLVDELVDEADLRGGAVAFARKVVAENRPLKKIRDRSVTADPALFTEFRAVNARKFRGFDAPEANIKC